MKYKNQIDLTPLNHILKGIIEHVDNFTILINACYNIGV